MYEEVQINVKISGGAIKDFPIIIGLHEVSALHLFLYVGGLNEILRLI